MGNTFTTTTATAPPGAGSPLLVTSKWSVIVAPVGYPVTTTEASRHSRMLTLSPAEETYVALLIAAATDYAEERLSASLMPRTLRATFYDAEPLVLPRGPIIEVLAITDRDQVAVTDYELKNYGRATQVIANQHGGYPLSITYQAGYASADAVPADIKLAILTHVGTLYENRESVSDKARIPVPHTLDDFYRMKSRSVGIG